MKKPPTETLGGVALRDFDTGEARDFALFTLLTSFREDAQRFAQDPDFGEEGPTGPRFVLDVRLQIFPGGSWTVHAGDPAFDPENGRGFWGRSTVCSSDDDAELHATALDLVEDAAGDAKALGREFPWVARQAPS
jgi:hypothetical protein